MALSTDTDALFLARAIELAEGGRGAVNPNPLVGALVVRDGQVLGEGFHARYGEAHAERNALAACTVDPRGATLYVSLEPCCHHGNTPPCTDAIRYYAALERDAELVYEVRPDAGATGRAPFSYDFSFNAYPLGYDRMGPEVRIYKLSGGKC